MEVGVVERMENTPQVPAAMGEREREMYYTPKMYVVNFIGHRRKGTYGNVFYSIVICT